LNELEEIKNRIDIVDYVGSYVTLKQTGKNLKACCPFHSEKTPSFVVSPDRQMWHCFGACGEGGDIFSFAMKMEGLTFPEAVQTLADKAGVKLEKRSYEKSDTAVKAYSANELAADYYIHLLNSDAGKVALKYLKDRGLTAATIKDFGLGFSPTGKDALQKELKKHNLSVTDLEKAGLVAQKQGEWRDFFWGRLMFPLRDMQGRTVGFSARTLDPDGIPKYINTTETEIYHKSNILYGIDLAKESIRKADNAILVEGQMDTIASRQAGVKNVVAPGGTALTENQLKLLGRMTKNLKLAFDVDFAGSEATRRAIEIAWEQGFNLKVIVIPTGKDPADAVAEDPKIWKEAVANAVYVVDYLFSAAFARYKKGDPIGRKKIAAELLPVIKRIPDDIERNTYIKKLAKGLSVDEKSIEAALTKVQSGKKKVKEEAPSRPQMTTRRTRVTITNRRAEMEGNIIGLLMEYPHYLDFAVGMLAADDFTDELEGKDFERMIKYWVKEGKFSEKAFIASLKEKDRERFNLYAIAAETSFADFDEEKKAEEIYFGVKRLKKHSLDAKKMQLTEEIAASEAAHDKKAAGIALAKFQALLDEERSLS
jgi:DNA primase